MNPRSRISVAVLVAAAGVLLVGAVSAPNVGRYQLISSKLGGLEVLHRLDTMTGQIDGFSVPPFDEKSRLRYGHFASVTPSMGISQELQTLTGLLCEKDFLKLAEETPARAIKLVKEYVDSRALCSITPE